MSENKNIFDQIEQIINDTIQPTCEWRLDRSHRKEVVIPRHFAFWLLYYYTNESLTNVGFNFGRRASCSVSGSISDLNDLIMTDADIAEKTKMLMGAMDKLGLEMINKKGRINRLSLNSSLAFHGIFKTRKEYVFLGYDGYKKIKKPHVNVLNTNFLVDSSLVETYINVHYPQQRQKRANDFYSGVLMAEQSVLPSYKQLLDFYNSIPKEFYVKVE